MEWPTTATGTTRNAQPVEMIPKLISRAACAYRAFRRLNAVRCVNVHQLGPCVLHLDLTNGPKIEICTISKQRSDFCTMHTCAGHWPLLPTNATMDICAQRTPLLGQTGLTFSFTICHRIARLRNAWLCSCSIYILFEFEIIINFRVYGVGVLGIQPVSSSVSRSPSISWHRSHSQFTRCSMCERMFRIIAEVCTNNLPNHAAFSWIIR